MGWGLAGKMEDGVEGLTEGVAVVKGMPKQEHAQAVWVVAAAHMEGKVAAARFAGGGFMARETMARFSRPGASARFEEEPLPRVEKTGHCELGGEVSRQKR